MVSNLSSLCWLRPHCNFLTDSLITLVCSSSSPAPHANLATPQQVRMSASYATRELDELMASLSDFKVSQRSRTSHSLLAPPLVLPVHALLSVCVARLFGLLSARTSHELHFDHHLLA